MSALLFVAVLALCVLLWAAATDGPRHISSPTRYPTHTNNTNTRPSFGVEPHGLCICDPRPPSSPIGECPDCHRLDPGKAYA